MDAELLRGVVTVAAFVAFLAVVAWAWSGSRRARFEEAARLPFEGEERNGGAQAESKEADRK